MSQYASFDSTKRWSAGLIASLALHLVLFIAVFGTSAPPKLDVTFVMPMDVEFGMTEGMKVQPPAPSAAAPEEQPTAEKPATQDSDAITARTPDAGVDEAAAAEARELKKKRRQEERARRADERAARKAREARANTPPVPASNTLAPSALSAQATDAAAYAPPGAQIALRVDFAKIRTSELAEDVRQFLGAIPDWQAVLEGSGIDPLNDLERLLVATPDLRREHLVMSGQYAGDDARVRDAVAKMAAARAMDAPWRDENGVQIAPWRNADETARILALVGPSQFTITREDDLPRVLAIAAARAEANKKAEEERLLLERVEHSRPHARAHEEPSPTTNTAPDAGVQSPSILSMDDGNELELDVEGARNFVQGNVGIIPISLHLSLKEPAPNTVALVIDAPFENQRQADSARDYWNSMRTQYAAFPLAAIRGFNETLRAAVIVTEGPRIHAEARLSFSQVRFLLGYIQAIFQQWAEPRTQAAGTALPPHGTSPLTARAPFTTRAAADIAHKPAETNTPRPQNAPKIRP